MRIFERSLYFLVLCQIISQTGVLDKYCQDKTYLQRCLVSISIILVNIVNIKIDGFRLATVPCLLTSHIMALIAFTVPYSFINDFEKSPSLNQGGFSNHILIALNFLGLVLSLAIFHHYGEADFSKFHTKGSFNVGFKEFHVEETKCAVSVFYPMDRK